jgi:hypothetical protein
MGKGRDRYNRHDEAKNKKKWKHRERENRPEQYKLNEVQYSNVESVEDLLSSLNEEN